MKFTIENHEICIQNHEIRIENDEFRIENDEYSFLRHVFDGHVHTIALYYCIIVYLDIPIWDGTQTGKSLFLHLP